jgi:Family of unknown function (DUF6516)
VPQASDYKDIVNKFSHIFREPPDLDIQEGTETVIKITFYLNNISSYGDTKLRVREWYNDSDIKTRYRYAWEKNRTKPGHISAWENEHHDVPHGLDTDPHHHHHVPGDRTQVQENRNVRDLDAALSSVEEYISNNKPYDSRKN